ncbi:hypothetical protein ASPZODRAFT_13535 [Penicilliopsis zonata CBS 506.65]|uniref:Uncharacterized protein n=1 Tax=Penicilliopsis zonata CBS 506.65 TaxID=1073090 RepID=A0A1L9SNJ1_9EURO|nr:hypothetical protein ASPZODRAFT_13535 [Penicilliopsis zonata CBS 506.65]OJJ48795.1 hypothetical protein ASPZODRAFT_13535 [Penicilliopsis zonata CBS 506.65]
MSESIRSEKTLGLTRFSTPVPELDDHRFHLQPPSRGDNMADISPGHQNTVQQPFSTESPERADLLHVQDALREAGSIFRDFEHAVVDDDRSVKDVNTLARRFSVDPTGNRRNHRTRSRTQQDFANLSRESSPSARSSSPPNSVEAFADPRRRERANTLESHAAPDLETILQRTVSGGTHPRRPTFSNASVIRTQAGTGPLDVADDICALPYEEPGRIPVIDYEELEEFVALNKKFKPAANRRKHSLSSQSQQPRLFHDLRPSAHRSDSSVAAEDLKLNKSSTDCLESTKTLNGVSTKIFDEKELLDNLQNANEPTRFSFFSSESQSTVHAAELGDLVLPGDTFRDLFQLGPEGGVWWLDVVNPTEDEVGALSRAFSIHPLTTEDIMTQEAREKVELFKQYYFVCFRTFYQMDKTSEQYLEPVNCYMVVFRDGVITFSFTENPHAASVRKRIGKLRDYVSLSSDWICYAMIDDIVDSFGPVIREVEIESEAIEDDVFIARVDDFESFLHRIGGLRKKVMSLMRLLGGKADVIRGFSKRCNEQYSVTPRGDIGLYLGDIQDHVVTMMSNLAHFEKMLSRSHANYLAQLNVTNITLGNHVNKVLSKVTMIATILVPMNLICGLFGMNVNVPGKNSDGLGWFFGIIDPVLKQDASPPHASGKDSRIFPASSVDVTRSLASASLERNSQLHFAHDSRIRRLGFILSIGLSFDSPYMLSFSFLMRSLRVPTLQIRFAALLHVTLSLFVLICVLNPNLAHGAELPQKPPENGSIELFAVPSTFHHGKVLGRGSEGESQDDAASEVHVRDLLRRVPSGVTSIGNNQFQQNTVDLGVTQWYYFPKDEVNGNKSDAGTGLPAYISADRVVDYEFSRRELKKRNGELSKRSATVYISLTACSKPSLNTSSTDSSPALPALEIYVSTSEELQKPGPGKDSSLQSSYTMVEGYVNATVEADGNVYIGVTVSNSTAYSGGYNYEIAASIDALFHRVETEDSFLYFVDSDTDAALLVTNNLTQSLPNSTNYQQWMNITPPFTMFANNMNNSAINGLRHSYCALDELAQIRPGSDTIQSSMTSRGLGNKPKEQFYVIGLNRSSSYYGILAMDGNSTDSGNGIVGGGGKVWKAMNFTTKTDNNCAVIWDLSFCNEVAYAVPSNPDLSVGQLSTIYDDFASAHYKNFNYSLDQIQCNTSAESMFSLAVTCDDCAAAYKEWLCAVSIPRCYDFSSNLTYLQVRNAGQPFLNGSSIPADSPLRLNPATNGSRNPLIDTEIRPGPYKEILPCKDICYDLVRKCPSALGFGCPTGKWLNSSYGWRDPDGDITCSYLGAAYYLSAGWRLLALHGQHLWLGVFSALVAYAFSLVAFA